MPCSSTRFVLHRLLSSIVFVTTASLLLCSASASAVTKTELDTSEAHCAALNKDFMTTMYGAASDLLAGSEVDDLKDQTYLARLALKRYRAACNQAAQLRTQYKALRYDEVSTAASNASILSVGAELVERHLKTMLGLELAELSGISHAAAAAKPMSLAKYYDCVFNEDRVCVHEFLVRTGHQLLEVSATDAARVAANFIDEVERVADQIADASLRDNWIGVNAPLVLILCDGAQFDGMRGTQKCREFLELEHDSILNTASLTRLDQEICVYDTGVTALVCFDASKFACNSLENTLTNFANVDSPTNEGRCGYAEMLDQCVVGVGPVCKHDACETSFSTWLTKNGESKDTVSYESWRRGAGATQEVVSRGGSRLGRGGQAVGEKDAQACENEGGAGGGGAIQATPTQFCWQQHFTQLVNNRSPMQRCVAAIRNIRDETLGFRSRITRANESNTCSNPLVQTGGGARDPGTGGVGGEQFCKDDDVGCVNEDFVSWLTNQPEFRDAKRKLNEFVKNVMGSDVVLDWDDAIETGKAAGIRDCGANVKGCNRDKTSKAAQWLHDQFSPEIGVNDNVVDKKDPKEVGGTLIHEMAHEAMNGISCTGSDEYCQAREHYIMCDSEAIGGDVCLQAGKARGALTDEEQKQLDEERKAWKKRKDSTENKYCAEDDIDCLDSCSPSSLRNKDFMENCTTLDQNDSDVSPLAPWIYPEPDELTGSETNLLTCLAAADAYRAAEAKACATTMCISGNPRLCESGTGCCCDNDDGEYATGPDSALACEEILQCSNGELPTRLGNGCSCPGDDMPAPGGPPSGGVFGR